MKGRYEITISNALIKYELILERQVTILRGDSGTGKSTLVNLASIIYDNGAKSAKKFGVHCNLSEYVRVLNNRDDFNKVISESSNCIFFVDEYVEYVNTKAFGKAVEKSDCYFVIVSRSGVFCHLTYSINSVFELGTEKSGNASITKLYPLYNNSEDKVKPDLVITEDSNSGYELFCKVFDKACVEYAGGKDKVYNKLLNSIGKYNYIYIIVDGAAFGNSISKIYNWLSDSIILCAYESFEYMLLNTQSILRYINKDILINTFNYCDSKKFISWESFYTRLLNFVCETKIVPHFSYSKKSLPDWFKTLSTINDVKLLLTDIDW